MVASFALRVSALNGDTEAVTRQLARGRRRGYPGRWIDDVNLRGVNLQKQRELSRELCDGQCPALFLAAYNGHDAIVRLLLHEGADANLPNSSGQTALFAACTGGHEVSVKELGGREVPCSRTSRARCRSWRRASRRSSSSRRWTSCR